jgi:hypothetical protein
VEVVKQNDDGIGFKITIPSPISNQWTPSVVIDYLEVIADGRTIFFGGLDFASFNDRLEQQFDSTNLIPPLDFSI